MDAFGVGPADEVSKAEKKASAGRQALGGAFPGIHGAIAGKKGHKLRAVGNELGGATAGGVAGFGAGAIGGMLVGRKLGGRVGAGVGSSIGGTVGSQIGNLAGGVAGTKRAQKMGHYKKDKIKKNMDPFGIEEIRKGFGVKADEFNRGFKAAKVLRQRKKLGLDRANYGTSAYAINSDLHTDASFSAAARAGAGANQFLHDPATKIAAGAVGGTAAYSLHEKRKKDKVKKNMDPFGVEEIRKAFGKPKISPEKIASLMPKKPSALQTRTNLAASKRMRLQAKKNTQGK